TTGQISPLGDASRTVLRPPPSPPGALRLGFRTVTRKTALVTSRIPRDSRLRLVGPRPLPAAPQVMHQLRPRRPAPRPPEGTPARAELAGMARSGLAGAARIARWADTALGPGRGSPAGDRKATLADASAEPAAADHRPDTGHVRPDWDAARP